MQLGRCGDSRRGRPFLLEPETDSIVDKLGLVVHERVVYRGFAERPVVGDVELDDDGEPVLTLVQRGEIGREPFRQHGEDGDAGVDGSGVGGGVLIGGRADRNEPFHIRDTNADSY